MNSRTSMIRGRAFHYLTAALMLSAASVGCAQQGTDSASETGKLEAVPLAENAVQHDAPALAPFATIQLESGRRVEFVDLGDGDIGMGEVGPFRGEPVVGVLTREWNATPLEVFMALAGDTQEPPARLVDAHAALSAKEGRAMLSPRKLPGEQNIVADGFDSTYPNCGLWIDTDTTYWELDWVNTYNASRDVAASAYLYHHNLSTAYAFYAGGNPVTAANMGVCVDDHWYYGSNSATDEVRFRVFAKTSGSASGCGGSGWGTALYDQIVDEFESANFYTSSISGKLVCATVVAKDASTDIRDVGIGTAYNLPPPIGGGS